MDKMFSLLFILTSPTFLQKYCGCLNCNRYKNTKVKFNSKILHYSKLFRTKLLNFTFKLIYITIYKITFYKKKKTINLKYNYM